VKVIWTPRASRELRSIHEHISKDSVVYANRTAARIIDRLDQIAEFPYSGREVPELGVRNVREVIEPPYRIIYRLKGEGLHVVAIIHSSRKLR
jgi:toxin ParE1/3/4